MSHLRSLIKFLGKKKKNNFWWLFFLPLFPAQNIRVVGASGFTLAASPCPSPSLPHTPTWPLRAPAHTHTHTHTHTLPSVLFPTWTAPGGISSWALSPHTPLLSGNKNSRTGLPWQSSGEESTCPCRGLRFSPWSVNIPHTLGQPSLCPAAADLLLQASLEKKPAHRQEV